jgi:hypothetical protein
MNPCMRRRLSIGLVVLLGLFVTAAPSSASIAGSFHLPQKVIGCRWTAVGPSMGLAARRGAIRCERYSDHTLVKISRLGRAVVVHHWKGWIDPGAATVRKSALVTRRLGCFVLRTSNGRILQCTFMKKSGHGFVSEFSISRDVVEIKN